MCSVPEDSGACLVANSAMLRMTKDRLHRDCDQVEMERDVTLSRTLGMYVVLRGTIY